MERGLQQVKNARLYLIPASEETLGHGTVGIANFLKLQLEEFMQKTMAPPAGK